MKFPHGRVVATPGAIGAFSTPAEASELLARHLSGDFGDMPPEDVAQNNLAIENDARIMSAYRTTKDVEIWVITEADRSATTFVVPDEY